METHAAFAGGASSRDETSSPENSAKARTPLGGPTRDGGKEVPPDALGAVIVRGRAAPGQGGDATVRPQRP